MLLKGMVGCEPVPSASSPNSVSTSVNRIGPNVSHANTLSNSDLSFATWHSRLGHFHLTNIHIKNHDPGGGERSNSDKTKETENNNHFDNGRDKKIDQLREKRCDSAEKEATENKRSTDLNMEEEETDWPITERE